MGFCFKKKFKRATALALIFAVSLPVSATQVTWTMKQHINENESFESIAAGSMNLSIRDFGFLDNMEDGVPLQRTETIRYLPAVEVAKEDIQQVKRSVVASDLLSYPQSYDAHKEAFQNLLAHVYRNTQLGKCQGNPLEEISVNLFKVSQKHLSKSKERLEWVPDETLGAFFTFTNNKDQKVSILIRDLNAVLPLYMEHRRSSLDSLAPDGVALTADQRITGQFINRILSGEIPGNPLKRGIKFRLQNLTGLTLEELVNRFTGRNVPLQVQVDNYAETRKAFDKIYIERSLLPILFAIYPADSYKTYDAFINYKGSGYKHGMNMNDYWQLWINSKYGEKAKKHVLPKYELPIDLIRDRQTYDRQFIENILLPTILEFYPYDPYKTYQDFIKPNNGSGYKVGMDLNKYWDSWLNSRYRAAVEKRPLRVYQPPQV